MYLYVYNIELLECTVYMMMMMMLEAGLKATWSCSEWELSASGQGRCDIVKMSKCFVMKERPVSYFLKVTTLTQGRSLCGWLWQLCRAHSAPPQGKPGVLATKWGLKILSAATALPHVTIFAIVVRLWKKKSVCSALKVVATLLLLCSKEFTSFQKPMQLIELCNGNSAVPIDCLPMDPFFFCCWINQWVIQCILRAVLQFSKHCGKL